MIPKISIVTPSFNQGQYIEQTIDSILSQNYPHLEYIIMDGGSKDNTVEIIKKYEKFLTYWVSEPDKGQSDAINKGLRLCTGEVFNWLNSDDYYEKNTLKLVGEAFMDENCFVFCGRSRVFRKNETIAFSSGTDVFHNNLAKTIGWSRIDQPETFLRRAAFDKIGFVNQDLHYIMDKELWMRILFMFGLDGIKQSDEILAHFRLHDGSKTVSFSEKFSFETDGLFYAMAEAYHLKAHSAALKNNFVLKEVTKSSLLSGLDQNLVLKAINYYLLLRFEQLYASNNFNKAERLLSSIDINLLEKEDVVRLNSIKKRLKLPPIFKIIYNTIKK